MRYNAQLMSSAFNHVVPMVVESDGRYERSAEEQANRYFTVSDMRGLVRRAGLAEREFVHAYGADPAVTADTWHVLVVATPAGHRDAP